MQVEANIDETRLPDGSAWRNLRRPCVMRKLFQLLQILLTHPTFQRCQIAVIFMLLTGSCLIAEPVMHCGNVSSYSTFNQRFRVGTVLDEEMQSAGEARNGIYGDDIFCSGFGIMSEEEHSAVFAGPALEADLHLESSIAAEPARILNLWEESRPRLFPILADGLRLHPYRRSNGGFGL